MVQVDYFKRFTLRDEIFRPIQVCECWNGLFAPCAWVQCRLLTQCYSWQVVGGALTFDVWATVKGGGLSAQAGAIRLGVARALQAFDEQHRSILKEHRLLTQEDRKVLIVLFVMP